MEPIEGAEAIPKSRWKLVSTEQHIDQRLKLIYQ
jgi:hypothetical protein